MVRKVLIGNFKGQTGDKGDTGAKGDVGATGLQGLKGEQGLQGLKGEQGDGITPTQLASLKEEIRSEKYDVGDYIISNLSTTPTERGYLGTWVAVGAGRMLMATTSGTSVDGGSSSLSISIANLPSHTHIQNAHKHGIMMSQYSRSTGTVYQSYTDAATEVSSPIVSTTATNQNTGGGTALTVPNPPNRTAYMWYRIG